MDNIGEPYVTTRPADEDQEAITEHSGLGLGFFIAKTLLERSGATVTLSKPAGAATRAPSFALRGRGLLSSCPPEALDWPGGAGRGLECG